MAEAEPEPRRSDEPRWRSPLAILTLAVLADGLIFRGGPSGEAVWLVATLPLLKLATQPRRDVPHDERAT